VEPLVPAVTAFGRELYDATGGDDASPQRKALVRSAMRLELSEAAISLRFRQTADPELASRLSSVATAKRAILRDLGLERAAQPVPSLQAFMAQRHQTLDVGLGGPSGGSCDSQPETDCDRPPLRDEVGP